ncbi:DUF3443 domain-containing protein [Chromobacterium phragmitis]|uniref:DUF3443 domain-containing protein n=1 Tax=Chromobacterium phragmitis TaxID=2202141 RepID=A0A344UMM0_9NEIS|nr:DUF3443 domain-containing protein [Chromobacterium phragmitis]AXE36518.1 hypothetical protein DK843_20840 [Chromobacterium phragmitis]
MRSGAIVGALLCVALLLSGCGGGGGGGGNLSDGSNNGSTSTAANSVAMTVDAGPVSSIVELNLPYVSVTVCAPGSAGNCQTIDHVLVDTGSSGLRILSSAMSASLRSALGSQLVAGRQVVECMQFADGITWGAVSLADVKMAGKTASSLPVQVISDPVYTTIPAACSSLGSNEGSLSGLGANGIIGVGLNLQDCGDSCATNSANSLYYLCAGASSCVQGAVPTAQQVANPVGAFSGDNNGVLLQLPSLATTGAATATGSLIFGIGTQSNNAISSAAQAFPVSSDGYTINTLYKGANYRSFLDSGSNILFFPDAGIATCALYGATWFCPASQQNLSAVLSSGASNSTVNFSVISAQYLATNNYAAIPGIAAPSGGVFSSYFDWGLPFFYGRNVYIGFAGRSNPKGSGAMYIF